MPNTVHSFRVGDNSDCEFFHIHFKPDLFSQIIIEETSQSSISIIDSLLFHCNFYYKQKSNYKLLYLVKTIIDTYEKDNCNFNSAHSNLCIIQILLYILENITNQYPLTQSTLIQNAYIASTLKYIDEHYNSKILVSDIANNLNISSRYLSKIFSKYMNVTLSNYINIYRINKAISLMNNTDMTLVDISLSIGLKDSQHFSRLFYKIIGISPLKYRKLIKNHHI